MKYLLIILSIFFISCSSGWKANWQLRRAEKLINKAELAGIQWKRDTVKIFVPIHLPADSGGRKAPQQAIDTTKVNTVLAKYDSLKEVVKAKETTEKQLRKANAEIRKLKQRIGKGFAKDSVYQVQADSLTTLYFSYKSGGLDSAWYHRLPEKVVHQVPVSITNEIKAEKSGLPWWVYAGFALCFIVIIRLVFK